MKGVLVVGLLLAQLLIVETSASQVVLPQLIRDSMVLQRDANINVWGWASKAEKVTIAFNKKTFKTTTGADGKWKIVLPATKAGGPYTMIISGKNKIALNNILIGDVWFCSGQSNMVHQLNIHDVRYADEIAKANFSEVRQFLIPTLTSLQGTKDKLPTGFWNAAVGEAVRPFSAVAYFFAKQLYQKYHVPIGIINASVGGTPIEAWTSEEGLKDFPALISTIQKNKDTGYINSQARIALAANVSRQNATVLDRGLTGPLPWCDINYIPKGWQTIAVPGYWEDQGISNLDGVVWYRKEIDVPASMVGKPAKVFLGRIVDADVLYINGKQVGATTYLYPQRRYPIPSDLLKTGKNIVVVKVTNNAGKGGFVSGKPYCLFTGNDTIDLKGYWQYKVGEVFAPQKGSVGNSAISLQNQPAALYNAMVAPVINYTIKGFLWYQGESNTNNASGYTQLQPAQIADWRSKWQQANLPFLWVQLPNFMDANYLPSESQWAELREAQLKSLSLSNTGMAVAIDLGEWNDIHPDNKKDVGERLALVARKVAYGEDIVYSGPLFQSASIDGNKITISFTNTGAGLVSKGGEPLSEFAIAGADKKFVWASAVIKGDKVIVWNDSVTAPLYVRYAWADNPVNPNLYNKEGLTASPFRTDQ
ncbi:sialate O-acetylesterase [Ferruginibacter paludis]|uniref:sialate O-acetylesterase n=1 Tax=Ferruginibacter paludis TaxID=1310417 RepID=UPI0025B60890|nr:sialate O-acetylesterase [Ferruginibacter paludis]MDN3655148.1 sialate O-acetylesterase [Ferruginibacter paludis]